MPNRIDRDHEFTRAHYYSRIGELFASINSSDHDVQCRAIATTNWDDIHESDAVALLAPLSTHSSAEVRQLVALQLATKAGAANDPRVLQALVTLATDDDRKVRTAAARSSYIANEFGLTPDGQFATSPAYRFVNWHQDGETTTLSFRCMHVTTAKRFLAIMAGLSAREMTHPSDEKQTVAPAANSDDSRRLPDVLIDQVLPDICDLPRKGTAKSVVNVAKGSRRLPEILVED